MHADREEGFCNDYDGSCPGREVPGIASSCYTLLQCTLSQPAGKLAVNPNRATLILLTPIPTRNRNSSNPCATFIQDYQQVALVIPLIHGLFCLSGLVQDGKDAKDQFWVLLITRRPPSRIETHPDPKHAAQTRRLLHIFAMLIIPKDHAHALHWRDARCRRDIHLLQRKSSVVSDSVVKVEDEQDDRCSKYDTDVGHGDALTDIKATSLGHGCFPSSYRREVQGYCSTQSIFQPKENVVVVNTGTCAYTQLVECPMREDPRDVLHVSLYPGPHVTRPGPSIRERLLGESILRWWPVTPSIHPPKMEKIRSRNGRCPLTSKEAGERFGGSDLMSVLVDPNSYDRDYGATE
ncbi:hypothetical protein ARMGADRAFT_1034152 [Armillaria gallica]|uniref:Uncharacterized protein n=1 Tax=Armillaria gallica TaxID=47427 RepID=A0A2H3D9S9_ARMGA|nr:hypothetical protein ARMGADRAFT_1034152 [Armillaria gallica]